MNILIATPLWPPELGGPANYAKNLTREFKAAGHKVRVVSFAKSISRIDPVDLNSVSFVSLKFPTGLRHFLIFGKLLSKLYRADILLALDQFSVGLPAAMACLFLRKPLILRVEGDFLWESFVERTRKDVTLENFYQNRQPLSFKERFIQKMIGWVSKRADRLAFSSEWRRSMILKNFKVSVAKTIIIQNVWSYVPSFVPSFVPSLAWYMFQAKLGTKIVLWAGRMLYLKNLQPLIRAFAKVNDGNYELHLVGEGPEKESLKLQVKMLKLEDKVKFIDSLPRDELLKLYRQAAFFVLPSLSEVGPNVITEAIGAGTPFIMTKESGYAEYVKNLGLLVDPLDEDDLAAKIKILMNGSIYMEYKNRLKSLVFRHDWHETAGEWMALFHETCRDPYRHNSTRKNSCGFG